MLATQQLSRFERKIWIQSGADVSIPTSFLGDLVHALLVTLPIVVGLKTMNDPSPSHQKKSWTPCQPGTIQKVALSNNVSGLDRRNFLQGLAGIGGAAAIVVGVSYQFGWLGDQPTPTAGKIGCVQVHQHLADYIANRIQDADLRTRIAHHLRKCVSCQETYRGLVKDNGCSGVRCQPPVSQSVVSGKVKSGSPSSPRNGRDEKRF